MSGQICTSIHSFTTFGKLDDLLSLIRGPLQHERNFEQSIVILKLIQHLQQEDNGSVHMRCKTSRAIYFIYWNTPDALSVERRKTLTMAVLQQDMLKQYRYEY